MENSRQKAILEIISSSHVETQEQLVAALSEKGFPVTQATISRDIKVLGIKKKASGSDKAYYYCSSESRDVPEHYNRVLREGFLSSDIAMNILVIKTVSGMAMAVAAALDAYNFPELVGCIAGDDTVMCAIRDVKAAKKLQEKIKDIIS